MSCNDCNPCNECEETVDPCLETCGCAVEISSLSCVRHDGNDFPCIEVIKGDTLEAIIEKINNRLCDVTAGLDGEDGEAGQGIDHVMYVPDNIGDTAGQPGQLDTYTVWGDVAETINMGTFTVYNGSNGDGIDHVSFTSTSGPTTTAGAAGQTDTYTLWADVAETTSLGTYVVYNGSNGIDGYDSDWVSIPDYSATNGFGLAAYTTGWIQPKVRVVGKTVFLEGYILIPLSSSLDGSVFIDAAGSYESIYRANNTVYNGVDGGFNSPVPNTLKSLSPILPQELTPSERHFLNNFEMSYRNVGDAKNSSLVTLTSIFPETVINTDGTIELTTLRKVEFDGVAADLQNSPYNLFVTRVTSDAVPPDYSGYLTQYSDFTGTVDERQSPISVASYPSDFDGNEPTQLGGFLVKLTTNYPIGENITQTQIVNAIASL